MISDGIRMQTQMYSYLERAFAYYVFARKAVMLGVMPVGGNLFHSAIEMILRCGLSIKFSQSELSKMEKARKHMLPDIWTIFKDVFSSPNLAEFDTFINHQQRWKELKYPESASTIFYGRSKPDPETMKKNVSLLKTEMIIEINLEEMDRYMTTVVQSIGIDPEWCKMLLQSSAELMDFYFTHNTFPLFDRKLVESANLLKV